MNYTEYGLSLKLVGILVGLLVCGTHVFAYLRETEVRQWLKRFPRSQPLGVVLLCIDLLWAFWLAWVMDWGEFYRMQWWILVLLPVFFFLTLQFVDEFLAVRALGILMLLGASPLLDAAFLQPPVSRLLLVVLAYVWIILGMFWVGQPHLMRDQIDWVQRSALRWRAALMGGIAYGALLLLCALVFY